jgi:hypothetical protein
VIAARSAAEARKPELSLVKMEKNRLLLKVIAAELPLQVHELVILILVLQQQVLITGIPALGALVQQPAVAANKHVPYFAKQLQVSQQIHFVLRQSRR